VIVKQIWTANSYRNFNYLIACKETGEALAIDPLDYEKCLAAAKAKGWNARKTRIRIMLMTIFFRGGSISCRTGRVHADCLREGCQPYPWRARNGSP